MMSEMIMIQSIFNLRKDQLMKLKIKANPKNIHYPKLITYKNRSKYFKQRRM